MNKISFQYIKTYMGFRGEAFTEKINKAKSEIEHLEKHIKTNINFKERYSIKQKIKGLKNDLNIHNIKLIDAQNDIHIFAREIAMIKTDTKIAKQLISILENRVEEPFVVTACSPIYRDAIVFFNDNCIIKIVHCCFECVNIIDEKDNPIFLEPKGFQKLQSLLINLGHEIT
ncbi:MAG: hypothetical protein AB8G11_01995 [Saprospiraceae bacterium]